MFLPAIALEPIATPQLSKVFKLYTCLWNSIGWKTERNKSKKKMEIQNEQKLTFCRDQSWESVVPVLPVHLLWIYKDGFDHLVSNFDVGEELVNDASVVSLVQWTHHNEGRGGVLRSEDVVRNESRVGKVRRIVFLC